MQTKSKGFAKSRSKWLLFFLLLLWPCFAWAPSGSMPIDDTEIRLPDGREIIAKRAGVHSHYIILKKDNKILWRRWFEEQYDCLWDYAFFVPVVRGQYSYDVNGDGYPEIGIATWDGGNNIADRWALVFTVKEKSLRYFEKRRFNLEYGECLYGCE